MLTVLIEASPWDADTGAAVPVYLAGGGSRAYRHRGRNDWLAGVVDLPRFSAAFEFSENGFSGGTRPDVAAMAFSPGTAATLTSLAALFWIGAEIEVLVGDDAVAAPAWTTMVKGVVDELTIDNGVLTFRIRDAAGDLDKQVAADRFGGTGGIDGEAVAKGRVKRRSFGYCSNVEALPLKSSTLIYELGDPAFELEAIDDLRDMGRSASSLVSVAWAGSVAATLAALEAASAPIGGGAIAPSIACVKWWTQPALPLTADIRGEKGAGFVYKPAEIAQRVIAARSTIVVSNAATAATWRTAHAGIHFGDAGETVAQGLDRLLKGCSLNWIATPAGDVEIREITFTAPVETLVAANVRRARSFRPTTSRRLGYDRNHRVHNAGEVSAALYDDDGNPLSAGAIIGDNLRLSNDTVPTQSEILTAEGEAASIAGQGALATLNEVDPAAGQVAATGSIPVSVPDNSFSYTSGSTTVTVSWPNFTIYRADGTTIAVAAGNIAIASLPSGATFRVYPYLADSGGSSGTVSLVTGGDFGSPVACFNGASAYAASQMNLLGRIPLGAFSVSTTTGGSGGGGGGGAACLHPYLNVGREFAWKLKPGSRVETPDGEAEVLEIARASCSTWFAVKAGGVLAAVVTRDHVFYRATDRAPVKVQDIRLGDLLAARDEVVRVTGVELLEELAQSVGIRIPEPSLHFIGPLDLLTHNGTEKP